MTDDASSQSPEAAQNKSPRSNRTPDHKPLLPALPALALTPKASGTPGSGPAEAHAGRRKQAWSASDVHSPTTPPLHRFPAPLQPGQNYPRGGPQPAVAAH